MYSVIIGCLGSGGVFFFLCPNYPEIGRYHLAGGLCLIIYSSSGI